MGATIDYGILFTSYYREMRATLSVGEAIVAAYKGRIHTILTSGTIMVLITAVIGPLFGNPTIEQIVRTLVTHEVSTHRIWKIGYGFGVRRVGGSGRRMKSVVDMSDRRSR